MKRTIFISLFLLLSAGTIIAQDETFHDGRKWVIREYTVNPYDSLEEILTCVVNGDTALGGGEIQKSQFSKEWYRRHLLAYPPGWKQNISTLRKLWEMESRHIGFRRELDNWRQNYASYSNSR